MKKIVLFMVFSILVMVGSIRFIDEDMTGRNFRLLTNIDNLQDSTIDDVKVKYLLLDGPEMRATSPIGALSAGDIAAKTAISDTHDLPPQEYMVRIYVYGDDGVRRIKHRPLIVK